MATRKPKGAKTRCNGTMTESEYLAWIRSALRSKWLRWKPRSLAIEAARRPYRGPNKLQKWEVNCAICQQWFKLKEIEVDHMIDAGSILTFDDIGPFVNRLYCEKEHLRVLCKPCHKVHTYAQSEGISFEEAKLAKKVLELLKNKEKTLAMLKEAGYTGIHVSNEAKRKTLLTKLLKENDNG